MDYGFKIKRADVNKSVEDCTPKECAFHSSYACAKILQTAKVSAENSSEQEVLFNSNIALPIIVLCFVYDSSTQKYAPVSVEFDATKVYIPAQNKDSGSYLYLFACYS